METALSLKNPSVSSPKVANLGYICKVPLGSGWLTLTSAHSQQPQSGSVKYLLWNPAHSMPGAENPPDLLGIILNSWIGKPKAPAVPQWTHFPLSPRLYNRVIVSLWDLFHQILKFIIWLLQLPEFSAWTGGSCFQWGVLAIHPLDVTLGGFPGSDPPNPQGSSLAGNLLWHSLMWIGVSAIVPALSRGALSSFPSPIAAHTSAKDRGTKGKWALHCH